MTLELLIADIKQYDSALPPVDDWDPEVKGEIDIEIKSDGSWHYQDSEFARQNLVSLLAKVLVEEDGQYWLKTPAEQLAIKVEDVPFMITEWHWFNNDIDGTMVLKTNVGQQVLLAGSAKLAYRNSALYIPVQRNLMAKVHRNVFYQWIEIAKEVEIDGQPHLVIVSDGQSFSLGQY